MENGTTTQLAETVVSTEIYQFINLQYAGGTTGMTPTALIQLERDGELIQENGIGPNPIDAAFDAIKKVVTLKNMRIDSYNIEALSVGGETDTRASVMVKVSGWPDRNGRGIDSDPNTATVKALIDAVNQALVAAEAAQKQAKASCAHS